MQKVQLTRVYISEKNKDGQPLISKAGKPYKKMSIKTQQHGDAWLSGFCNKANEFWKEGDTVEIIITQNGNYLNFEVPKEEDKLKEVVADLTRRVVLLENAFAKSTPSSTPSTSGNSGFEDIVEEFPEDLPF